MGLIIPGRNGTTLEAGYSGRDNAFNLMRLCFALLVIVGHAGVIGWGAGHDPMPIPVDLGGIAVSGFFGLSGFLISKSGRRSGPLRYVWHRVLRIFPGYWVCLIATALVLAPVLWWYEHGTIHGFRGAHDGPLGYIYHNFLTDQNRNDVAGVTSHAPYASVINGSLWTLKSELTCYLLVLVLALTGVLRKARWVTLVIGAALLGIVVWDTVLGPTEPGPLAKVVVVDVPVLHLYLVFYLLMFGLAFVFGMIADLYRSVIPLNDVLGVVALVCFVGSIELGWPLFGPAMVAYVYLLLWLGVRIPGRLRRIGRRNDYSYGVYIYAFPVQQALAIFGLPRYGVAVYLISSILTTLAIAMVSWHLVEKRAMRLKDWTPAFARGADRRRQHVGNPDVPPAGHPAPIEPEPEPSSAATGSRVPAPRSPSAGVDGTAPLVPIPRAAEAGDLEHHDH